MPLLHLLRPTLVLQLLLLPQGLLLLYLLGVVRICLHAFFVRFLFFLLLFLSFLGLLDGFLHHPHIFLFLFALRFYLFHNLFCQCSLLPLPLLPRKASCFGLRALRRRRWRHLPFPFFPFPLLFFLLLRVCALRLLCFALLLSHCLFVGFPFCLCLFPLFLCLSVLLGLFLRF